MAKPITVTVAGNAGPLLSAIDRINIQPDLFQGLMLAGATAGKEATFTIAFDLVDLRAVSWAERHSGEFITGITGETKKAIVSTVRDLVSRGLQGELTVPQISRALKRVIGLTDVHAGAVNRRYLNAIAQGTPEAIARRNADAYASRLLRWRTDTIARNETMLATHTGQIQAWREAKDRGLISQRTRRVWDTAQDERTCPVCAPMHGMTIGIDDSFVSTVRATDFDVSRQAVVVRNAVPLSSPVTVDTPPRHPRCRCTVLLLPA